MDEIRCGGRLSPTPGATTGGTPATHWLTGYFIPHGHCYLWKPGLVSLHMLCHVPLVVYTAQDLDQSDRQRLKLGQTLFLTKGRITPQEFEQRVINLLNRMIHGQEVE